MNAKRARELLKPYLVGTQEVAPGEWDMRCPLHDDQKRSARVNFEKGVWKCFAGCGGGRLAGLLKRMGATSEPRKRTSRSAQRVVKEQDVKRWHEALMAESVQREYLWSQRGLDEGSMRRFRLGWDQASQAFTIPIYRKDGSLYNVRKYRPNMPADRKIFWAAPRNADEPLHLFPEIVAAQHNTLVLCEGEMDAIIANQHGIPAITATAGAGNWQVAWSETLKGKRVYIAYDNDASGERGRRVVAEHLESYAEAIYFIDIPLAHQGADVTDYFAGTRTPTPPHSRQDFVRLVRKAKRYQKRTLDPTQTETVPVSVIDSFDSQNIGRALAMDVLVSGRSQTPFSVPKVVRSFCTQDAGPKCQFCPMFGTGERTYEVEPWSPAVLRMARFPEAVQNDALRKHIGAVKCDRLRHEVQSYQTVEQLYVRPSWEEESGDFVPRKVFGVGRHNTMPSQVVHLEGTTWPDPADQHNQFLAWNISEAESAIDEFRVTPDIVRTLRQFQPQDGEPLRKLWDIGVDLSEHVTRIYGRVDLHVAISLVYHSIISFPFTGKLEPRGWLDALVVGDTRTGKSEAARRMAQHYRLGKVVNCEAATFAGIIGGLQQMGGTREWAITWGAIPMNDRRLVVLDEASGLSYENIQAMSDVRSSGFILLQKIQSEQAWARTRLLWLSNPRSEGMDHYTYGVQSLPSLIGNREDIARFDFAMALTQDDVSLAQIQKLTGIVAPQYSSEDSHMLVLWAWSRKAEDVEWVGTAERDVLDAAEWLGGKYVPDPPLIQAANVRLKIARLAVALAAATYSSDSAGRKVLVGREHVAGALKFLHWLYKRETFGYYRMSQRAQEQQRRAVATMDEAQRFLLENRMLVRFLQVTPGAFRRDMMEQVLNASREEVNGIVNRLFDWGLLSPNGQAIRMSPMLHQLLREIEGEDA